MSRSYSPGYPNVSLPKAITMVRKIFEQDRRNPIDRAVAVKHMGYSGVSGAADKALGSLSHFQLLEKTGKGQVRVSQLALDILHPSSPEEKRTALRTAAFSPEIYMHIREWFPDGHPSDAALRSRLVRESFLDRAVNPVVNGYFDTCQFLEQEKAFESGSPSQFGVGKSDSKSETDDDVSNTVFGNAKVGDLVQWESGGVLQLPEPSRVRLVSDDGQWVAVEGSETGIPMSEVIVQPTQATVMPPVAPPSFPIAQKPAVVQGPGEREWLRGPLSKEVNYRLIVSGELGPREIGKLIKLLQAQQAVLSDDEDEDEI